MKITMKKMIPFLLLAFVGLFTLSCEKDRDVVDNTVYSTVYDLNRSFNYNPTTGIGTIREDFARALGNGDYVLMFIKADTSSNGSPIWAPMPRHEYNTTTINGVQQELYYDFDYTIKDFSAYVSGTYDIRVTPQYLNNITLRIILVPGTKGNAKQQDLSKLSYDEVIKKFNINDSKVTKL